MTHIVSINRYIINITKNNMKNTIDDLPEEYILRFKNEISSISDSLHRKLFPEEYEEASDSNADSSDRRNGINPLNSESIEKYKFKRKNQGVSPLCKNGISADNSSNILVEKIIYNYLSELVTLKEFKIKNKITLSDFLKH